MPLAAIGYKKTANIAVFFESDRLINDREGKLAIDSVQDLDKVFGVRIPRIANHSVNGRSTHFGIERHGF